ncbi:MAG TPA: hypothetical protein VFC61_04730 [Blastocatellia bacterium]|nr:hypothetical protein [Blastocatellia bacterium]
MRDRQLLFLKCGCWAAAITAAVHLIGVLTGPLPPANETEQILLDMASSYQFPLPGGGRRSLMEFVDGFSLSFSLFLATIGGVGLLVARRGVQDPVLMTAVTRALAGFSVVLLVISLTHFFLIPTSFIAVMTVCFVLAALQKPAG